MKTLHPAGIVAAVAFVIVLAALIISCERGSAKHSSIAFIDETSSASQPVDQADSQPVERSLTEIIAEIEEFESPDDVEADVFAALKAELVAQMTALAESADTDKLPSSAPTGDSGRVTDLEYDPDSDTLTWSYVNVGDYDLSGEVGISDIIPIAQNYLAKTDDGIGNDEYEAWVDGDGSGEVGISDITPIANNYLNDVMEYQLPTADSCPSAKQFPTGNRARFRRPTPSLCLKAQTSISLLNRLGLI